MNSKTRLFNLFVIAAVFLGACNLPSKASQQGEQLSQTAVAQTVEALLSATPIGGGAVIPSFTPVSSVPTLTPIPQPVFTNTPAATATSDCNVAQFVTDVTIPDGTIMTPSQAFTKRWRIKNIGSCVWTGFSLVFDNGESMGGPATKPIAVLNPGQEVDLEVPLTAPSAAGNYRGYWRITTNSSVLVPIVSGYQGKSFYVDIKVQIPVTATNTLPPAVVFAVTNVAFSVSGTCGSFSVTVTVTTNGAGTVNLHRIWNDGSTDGTPRTLTFASAGSQSFTEAATFSTTTWEDIYIDNPNHQQFGRATFTCP